MIGNLTFDDPSEKTKMYTDVVIGNGQISNLGEAPGGRFLISNQDSVLSSLLNYTGGIKELRIRCTKSWHDRVVDVVITEDYLKAVIEKTYINGLCEGGELRFLPDDTSLLKNVDCVLLNVAYGSSTSLYNHLLFGNNRYVSLIEESNRFECDDAGPEGGDFTVAGSWTYFVR